MEQSNSTRARCDAAVILRWWAAKLVFTTTDPTSTPRPTATTTRSRTSGRSDRWPGSGRAPRAPTFIPSVRARTSPGRSSTATSTTSSSSATSCNRSTRRPTDRSCSTASAITPTSSSRARWRPSTTRSGTGSGNRPPAPVVHTLAIPRGQVLLAAGTAEPDATEFEVSAALGSEVYGILSNPFLDRVVPHGQLPHARHGARRRHVVVRGAHRDARARP